MHPRMVIAGVSSGVGKTTVTIGLLAALRRRGKTVQAFKCGPDYIDPSYHAAVTGRPSRNLDTWMTGKDAVLEIFARGSLGADISLIEGVMGLYDGKDPRSNSGSTAEIAMLLQAPVLLVINASSMARSAAAVVKGFQAFEPSLPIAGVIANQLGSEGHARIIRAAVEQECGVPVVGTLLRNEDIRLPERHLGLIPALERGEMQHFFERAATWVEQSVDVDRILALAAAAPPLPAVPARVLAGRIPASGSGRVTIALARDSAFHFYYPENLEILESRGARLVEFSPLAGECPPDDADGLYIGGGFPEEFAAPLAEQRRVAEAIRKLVEDGMPVFAECGGLMYLSQSIETRSGNVYPMVGIFPVAVRMQSKLAALGYREVSALNDSILLRRGEKARGHEFHYSTANFSGTETVHPFFRDAYETNGLRGPKKEGWIYKNTLAGYTHLHFASNPAMADRWIANCKIYRRNRHGR